MCVFMYVYVHGLHMQLYFGCINMVVHSNLISLQTSEDLILLIGGCVNTHTHA